MSAKHYPIRIPRFAAGIRAQESRTGHGRSWWFREWIARLEMMGAMGRFARGRSYAVSGQVVSLEIAGPRVTAKIVGTRSEPYVSVLDFRVPEAEARDRIIRAITAEPILLARLLADDLPTEVREIFRAEGFDLFPGGKLGPRRYDVTTSCTCPDYANPCKHTSAVLYLLGEEASRHPLTLLELRGITEKELLNES